MNNRSIKSIFRTAILLVLLAWIAACETGLQISPEDGKNSGAEQTSFPVQQEQTMATSSPIQSTESIMNEDSAAAPGYIQQGAAFGFMDAYQVEEVATGVYDPNSLECGESWLSDVADDSGENVITLQYLTPVIPTGIELFTNLDAEKIVRVELLNSFSGLSIIYNENQPPEWEQKTNHGGCEKSLAMKIDTDIEVDTVFVEFSDLSSAAQLDSAMLSGRLDSYTQPMILWRVSLPATPVDMQVNPLGEIIVATDPNGLHKYDLQGNLLDEFSAADIAKVMSVEADTKGNSYVVDADNGGVVVVDSNGVQMAAGGDDLLGHLAFNPMDGNLYLLHDNAINVYTSRTLELTRQVLLGEIHSYGNLTFSPDGRLFVLRDYDWEAILVELDAFTGEEINAFPLENSNQGEIVARDLSVDAEGNAYVLYGMNTGEIAIHMYDANGFLVQRFGHLTSDAEGWTEGTFLDPRSIAVTPDGKFLVLVDGYADQSFLTAYSMENAE